MAAKILAAGPFGYISGGAGTGATMRANREAFDRRRLIPRMLTEATRRDLHTIVLGTELPAPIALAPVGVQSIAHPEAERATTRAAVALGLPSVLSTAASSSIEQAAGADAWPYWASVRARAVGARRTPDLTHARLADSSHSNGGTVGSAMVDAAD